MKNNLGTQVFVGRFELPRSCKDALGNHIPSSLAAVSDIDGYAALRRWSTSPCLMLTRSQFLGTCEVGQGLYGTCDHGKITSESQVPKVLKMSPAQPEQYLDTIPRTSLCKGSTSDGVIKPQVWETSKCPGYTCSLALHC